MSLLILLYIILFFIVVIFGVFFVMSIVDMYKEITFYLKNEGKRWY